MNKLFTAGAMLMSAVAIAQPGTDEQLAALYLQNKEYDKAARYYEKLFEANPVSYYYQPYLTCLLELGDFKTAEKVVRRQVKKNERELGYLVDLGYVYRRAGEDGKSRQQYERAIREVTASQDQIIALANSFLGRNESGWAEQTYLHGRKLIGAWYPFSLELAEIHSAAGEYTRMFDEYLGMLDVSNTYLQAVQNALQDKLANDPGNKRSEMLKAALLRRIQRHPDRTVFAELLIWYYMQDRDFASAFVQARALDKRLRENGSRLVALAEVSGENRDYDVAIRCYEYVIARGSDNPYYSESKIRLLELMNRRIMESHRYTSADLEKLEGAYFSTLDELGRRGGTALLIRDLARLQAFYLGKTEEAIGLLKDALVLQSAGPRILAEIKLELGDIYLLAGERWEATLLYAQVDKDFREDPIGHEAKLRNAKLSYYAGDFNWARAQLDILKAATSKLIANDALDLSLLITDNMDADSLHLPLGIFARADLLAFRNRDSLAMLTLDSISRGYPTHQLADEVLFRKAGIMEKQGRFEEAADYYAKVSTDHWFGILADDALFRLAGLHEERFGNTEKAMELYEKLLTAFPGSLYTVEARKRFRSLRGDKVN